MVSRQAEWTSPSVVEPRLDSLLNFWNEGYGEEMMNLEGWSSEISNPCLNFFPGSEPPQQHCHPTLRHGSGPQEDLVPSRVMGHTGPSCHSKASKVRQTPCWCSQLHMLIFLAGLPPCYAWWAMPKHPFCQLSYINKRYRAYTKRCSVSP